VIKQRHDRRDQGRHRRACICQAPNISSAGKTGTAQVFSYKGAEHKTESMAAHLRDHALFIAYAPADKPTIALAVLVENGGFGAQAAAPIARQVLDYYLLGRKPKAPAPTDEDAVEGDRE
jgi:penicillin-binding protein 2